MGREVRRVPASWEHPKDARGRYVPLHGGSYAMVAAEWDETKAKWDAGFVRDWFEGDWKPKTKKKHACSFEEWHGPRPREKNYMPDWPASARTHWQMYETTSEGTPISPVMESPEKLARWLTDEGASAFGPMTASYEGWLATIKSGYGAMSMVGTAGGEWESGVQAMAKKQEK